MNIEETAQNARVYFEGGLYCAESVLLALAQAQGVESDLVPRIATGFCSGLARSGGLCGALSGAIMGLSLAAGRSSHVEPVDPSYALVQALLAEFKAQHGAVSCPDLLGCDLGTLDGQAYYQENSLFPRCAGLVEDAAHAAAALLDL
jgi:C_GCAxxG_C_C family probable redox protein